jgi:ribosomal-protein-alanine N-acetyltransferase
MNADPLVMQYFPSTLSRSESDAFADRIETRLEADGFGLFAVEVRDGEPFIGFVGLARPSFEAHFTPAMEIGWRLDRDHWGRGYATEAALACVDYAFDDLGIDELVSFTVPANVPSRSVMERIGMTHDPSDDFDHPRVKDHPSLQRHVLYRLAKADHKVPTEHHVGR